MTISLQYLLETTPETQPSILGDKDGERVAGKSSEEIILGCGIRRPFQRDQKGDWANVCGEPLVRAAISQILGTRAQGRTTNGEIPWRPEFGSIIQHLRFRRMDDVMLEVTRTYVVDAITRWEPRVSIIATEITRDDDAATLIIDVLYNVLSAPGSSSVVAQNLFESVTV